MPHDDPPRDEHFIGWLPMPAGLRRFLWPAAGLFVAGLAAAGLLVAAGQRPAGAGTWEDDADVTLEGVLAAEPYALLRVPGTDGDRTVLLVEEGKFGARDRAQPLAGRAVRVTGTRLHRGDREMVELRPGPEGLQPLDEAPAWADRLRDPPVRTLGRVVLRGEVIDPKCYLGAMKPGNGKPHKGCAVRCISGGVPPMFVTRRPDGAEEFYLLTTPDGQSAAATVLTYVADPVEVEGQVEESAGLRRLRLEAIRRR